MACTRQGWGPCSRSLTATGGRCSALLRRPSMPSLQPLGGRPGAVHGAAVDLGGSQCCGRLPGRRRVRVPCGHRAFLRCGMAAIFVDSERGITIASCKASGAAGHYGRKAFSSMMAVNNGGPFRCRFPLRRCEMLPAKTHGRWAGR